jgi:hypothetical protein
MSELYEVNSIIVFIFHAYYILHLLHSYYMFVPSLYCATRIDKIEIY